MSWHDANSWIPKVSLFGPWLTHGSSNHCFNATLMFMHLDATMSDVLDDMEESGLLEVEYPDEEEETGDTAEDVEQDESGTDDEGELEDEQEGGNEDNQEQEEESSMSEDKGPVEGGAEEDIMEIQTNDEPSPTSFKEDAPKQEVVYSTRGRAVDLSDPLERLAREALGDMLRDKEPAGFRESFLSDAITEEERRTRTRYIPQVDGMHMLRKHEIKADLALARTNFASAGVASSVAASKAKAKRGSMDIDGDEAIGSLDDDRASDVMRVGTKSIEIGDMNLVVPSTAFVSPATDHKSHKSSPREVEAVTAFNPPRPPESVGAKKKHRMLRWERRPADIEVDLNNYRKTVHKTREELKRAVAEQQKLEIFENHLRRHFLGHLQSLSDEWNQLNKELAVVQQDCVTSADLLTSRTRSRGAGKGSYAMRDVLAVLRARGHEIQIKGLSNNLTLQTSEPMQSGAGGVGAKSFEEWDRSTDIKPITSAPAWLLPGDRVETPYGEGTVVTVLAAAPLDVSEAPHKDLHPALASHTAQRMDVEPSVPASEGNAPGEAAVDGQAEQDKVPTAEADTNGTKHSKGSQSKIVPTRVAVRLAFGVGFFAVKSVFSKEDILSYSDSRLALRWKGIAETAVAMGSVLDIEAMAHVPIDEKGDEMVGLEPEEGREEQESTAKGDKVRMVPFGSGLLPTSSGRGSVLWKLGVNDLDEIMQTVTDGVGILGSTDHQGVTSNVRELEDTKQKLLVLKAQALQLKNELYRQRRVRILNERTQAASQERAARVQALVAEMRTDLKTLKRRLDEELTELGMSEEQAESILTAFYASHDSKDKGEASPPKRLRRSRTDEEEEVEEDEDEEPERAAPMELDATSDI